MTFLSDAEESLRRQDGVIRRQREALAEIRERHREELWPDGSGSNCRECNGRRFPCPTLQIIRAENADG
jgi:hypothetical protein